MASSAKPGGSSAMNSMASSGESKAHETSWIPCPVPRVTPCGCDVAEASLGQVAHVARWLDPLHLAVQWLEDVPGKVVDTTRGHEVQPCPPDSNIGHRRRDVLAEALVAHVDHLPCARPRPPVRRSEHWLSSLSHGRERAPGAPSRPRLEPRCY